MVRASYRVEKRFILGVYRRHMKTIGYLGQIDRLFGVPATTRNWNTILAVVRILNGQEKKAADSIPEMQPRVD